MTDPSTTDPSPSQHAVSDRSPTQMLAGALHLPPRIVQGVERRRLPLSSAASARRSWVLEQFCLAAVVLCFVPALFYVVNGDVPRTLAWLAGSLYHACCYFAAVRGHGALFLTVVLPSIPVGLLALAADGGIGYAPACTIMAMLLCLCSISESVRTTAGYGLYLIPLAASTGVVVDAPRADLINVVTVMTVSTGIATAGSQVWTLTHRRTTAAMSHNAALAQQLRTANDELEAANQDLAAANHRLVDANAELERRVAERTRELHELSIRDELTGLHNRRHFLDRLSLAAADGSGLGVLMVDVDFFKSINDTCGHAVGDQVLRTLAEVMSALLDGQGEVARIGGEEFAVLVPSADPDHVWEIAQGLRRAVEDTNWPASMQPMPRRVTVSVGMATTAGVQAQPMSLLQDADAALYVSKHNGRNRVTVAAGLGEQMEQPGTPSPH